MLSKTRRASRRVLRSSEKGEESETRARRPKDPQARESEMQSKTRARRGWDNSKKAGFIAKTEERDAGALGREIMGSRTRHSYGLPAYLAMCLVW